MNAGEMLDELIKIRDSGIDLYKLQIIVTDSSSGMTGVGHLSGLSYYDKDGNIYYLDEPIPDGAIPFIDMGSDDEGVPDELIMEG